MLYRKFKAIQTQLIQISGKQSGLVTFPPPTQSLIPVGQGRRNRIEENERSRGHQFVPRLHTTQKPEKPIKSGMKGIFI